MKEILNLGCGNETYGTHRIDMYKTSATTEVGDLNKPLPYKDNFFDEVYCKCVLEHIKNSGIFIGEIYRVLKPNGKVFIRTDNAGYLPFHLFKTHEHNQFLHNQYTSTNSKAYGHEENEDSHYYLFVPSHLRKLFKDFKNIKINYVYGGRNGLNKFLLKLLPINLGAIHLELKAMK